MDGKRRKEPFVERLGNAHSVEQGADKTESNKRMISDEEGGEKKSSARHSTPYANIEKKGGLVA